MVLWFISKNLLSKSFIDEMACQANGISPPSKHYFLEKAQNNFHRAANLK